MNVNGMAWLSQGPASCNEDENLEQAIHYGQLPPRSLLYKNEILIQIENPTFSSFFAVRSTGWKATTGNK